MKLVINGNWIEKKDNPYIPDSIFRGGDEKIYVYKFKKCIIMYDIIGELLPIFEKFGGIESSYIGGKVTKIYLNHPDIELI